MRKTILTTAAIGFVALGLALGVAKSDDIKAFFASKEIYQSRDAEVATTTDTPADLKLADGSYDAAAVAADTTPSQSTTVVQDQAVLAEDQSLVSDVPSAEEVAEYNAEQAALNGQTPAAGEEEAAATTTTTAAAEEVTPADEVAAATEEVATEATATTESAAKTEEPFKAKFQVDVARALKDREIGSKDAPITVYDFSSLSCPHCAHFHNDVFPKVKENYIDKGKVRWVFRGFPLNEPALKAEMVARCAPEDQYEKLRDLMFKNQDRWAFTPDPLPNLSMLVKVAGINEDMFLGCVNNKDLEFGLAQSAQNAAGKYSITSTPTFVFNDGVKKFSGTGSYEGFATDIDQLLKYIQTPAQSVSSKLAPAEEAKTPVLTKE